jgi:peptidoglycan hydrolase-like protein with peptidoglycan-binding domain
MTKARAAAGAATLAAALAVAPAASANHPAGENGTASKPTINMERVLLAAQWDPQRPDNGITPRAKRSVLRVERRLARKGYLARSRIDGSFGSSTIAAYAAWQRHLGYSGLAATGLPGPTSLVKLAGRRYSVTHLVSPGPRVTYQGKTVNRRTKRMLRAAARLIHKGCHLALYQGSYNPGGVGPSGDTHAGGGAADVDTRSICGARTRAVVRALRTVGFAAWHRPYRPGVWPDHIHIEAVNDPDLSVGAQHQVGDYYEGQNGLDGGPDRGPKVKKVTWEQYQRRH